MISVPDDRLTKLVEMCNPRSTVPATVEIVDIAGLVKGASKGEGLGNKFLANIRETDAILHVLRCFDDDNITHVDTTVDPVRDMEVINYELQLKDLETVEARLAKTEKAAKAGGDKSAKMQLEVLNAYKEALLQGKAARSVVIEGKRRRNLRASCSCSPTSRCFMYVMWMTRRLSMATITWKPYVRRLPEKERI